MDSAYYRETLVTLNRTLNTHNNFLQKIGHLTPNLKQIVNIKVPKGYSQVIVVLFAHNTAIRKEYSLPSASENKVDLSHAPIKDVDEQSGWTMTREIHSLHAGQCREVSRSSTWAAVGLSAVAEYIKARRVTLPEWVLGWKGYSPQKKREVYDKECCHELNFFLSRTDVAFFTEVVRPFIANKLIKTFLDHFLLDDKEEILEYAKVHNLHKLN